MIPWLSILIPVYNVEAYLAECIDSVLSQYNEGVEIIVLDDRSTDGSLKLINEISENSKYPIKILQHEINSGLSAARNSLLQAAIGDYVWFLDSDDALTPNAVSQLYEVVCNHKPDLVMCDYAIWRTETKARIKYLKKDQHISSFSGPKNTLRKNSLELFSGLYREGKLHSWSKISRRALWQAGLKFPEGKYFEDMVTTPLLAAAAQNYYYVPNVWVKYRKRQGSILSMPSMKKIEDMSTGVNNVLDVWLKKCPDMSPRTKFIFINYCLKIYLFSIKELNKMEKLNANELQVYKLRLYENIKLNKFSLIKQCFLYGNPFRLIKLWRYL